MNIICLDKGSFPEKTFNAQAYVDKLPQDRISKLKRRIHILLVELDLF